MAVVTWRRVATHERGIGLMFQDYALFPHRDVAANVGFGLRMRGDPRPRREARVAEVLDLVGLAGFDHRAVSTLSGGERQRVALARALAPAPRLLMLDELLGALDRTLRDRLVVELSELFAQLSIGVIYVTHDQAEALALADRVVVMNQGRVAQTGAPEEVWRRPADAFVARFLGLTNVFTVAVTGGRLGIGGAEIDLAAADAADAVDPGDRGGAAVDGVATILIRPEAVGIGPVDGPRSGRAVVDAVAFRGDHTQVWLTLEDGTRLESRVSGRPRPEQGSKVGVVIDPAGVHAMDASVESGASDSVGSTGSGRVGPAADERGG